MTRRTPVVAATTDKQRWVVAQYEALLPEGQRAVDLCFKALPRRPVVRRRRRLKA